MGIVFLISVVVIMAQWAREDSVPVSEMCVKAHEGDRPCTKSGVSFIPELLKGYLSHMQIPQGSS